jgi:hypothetical protein
MNGRDGNRSCNAKNQRRLHFKAVANQTLNKEILE